MEWVFSMFNIDGFIEEGKKIVKKIKFMVIIGFVNYGIKIFVEIYMFFGWLVVGGVVIRVRKCY